MLIGTEALELNVTETGVAGTGDKKDLVYLVMAMYK